MLNDTHLIDHMKLLLKREAALDLEMIETLREIHKRKLYLSYGTSGFHEFCTKVLGMSADSAWRRMHAASLVDRFPDVVKPLIAEGKVHLTGLALLDSVITPENGERLIKEAAGKSKTEIQAMIAREAPKPDCIAGVRKLPAKAASTSVGADPRVCPLSDRTWKFQANLDSEGHALFAEVADLMGTDDCNAMLKKALTSLRDELRVKKNKALKRKTSASPASNNSAAKVATVETPEATGLKLGKSAKDDAAPVRHGASLGAQATANRSVDSATTGRGKHEHDPNSRYVPRWMEREVRERAGHRCTFVGPGGRCTARRHLQVHHIIAFAQGGPTELANLTLHCGSHNRYQAELDLGLAVANAWRQDT